MPEQVTFKCLRCGNEWRGVYDADAERMCPKCRSNSVRRIKDNAQHSDAERRNESNKNKP
jgi:predicted  nucleic acid-binding Zn-ribbon protein